jgi:four helix bundle protein
MQNYRRLPVWRKGHAIALNVYRLTEQIPKRGHAALIDQLRRSSLSIAANIAEGASRPTDKDFAKFLNIALASATETQYHLEFAVAVSLISHSDFELRKQELNEVRRMLTGFIKHLRKTIR